MLVAVSLWRIALIGCVFFSTLAEAVHYGQIHWIVFVTFTQISTLLVGLTALGALLSPLWNGGALEGRRGYLRGASTTCSLFTMIAFAALTGGDYPSTAVLQHLIIPVLALIDWIFVVRNSAEVQAWWPLVWLGIPLVWLPIYLAASAAGGDALYDFLDPEDPGFLIWLLGLLAGFLLIGYLVWGLGKLRGLVRSRRPPTPHHGLGR